MSRSGGLTARWVPVAPLLASVTAATAAAPARTKELLDSSQQGSTNPQTGVSTKPGRRRAASHWALPSSILKVELYPFLESQLLLLRACSRRPVGHPAIHTFELVTMIPM